MKIRTFKRVINDVYHVNIHTEDWSERDRDAMSRFGEPEVDIGGTIVNGSDIVHEMDESFRRVMTGSPFNAAFDLRDYEDAKDIADAWNDTIVARISDAVTALRLQVDGFTGESVVEV